MRRAIAAAGASLALTAAPAAAGDASVARLPPALSKVSAIERIYPALHAREVARKRVSWARLRRAARTAWMRSHPCADATLARRYTLGASSWSIVEATWACDGIDHGTRRFLRCIVSKEGGRDHPDVWYTEPSARARMGGNYRGWLNGKFAGTVRVVNHFQTRPYHARIVAPAVLDRVVTRRTFRILTHPVNAARIAVRVGRGAYVTRGLC